MESTYRLRYTLTDGKAVHNVDVEARDKDEAERKLYRHFSHDYMKIDTLEVRKVS